MMLRVWMPVVSLIAAAVVVLSAFSSVKSEDLISANISYSAGSLIDGNVDRRPVRGGAEYAQLFVKHTDWSNSIVLDRFLSPETRAQIPHNLQSWLRNYIAGIIVYFLSGGLWCFWVYWWKREQYFPQGNVPGREPIKLQILVSMKSMPLYTALPTLSEYAIEKGWTKCYSEIEEIGWANWLLYTCAYMAFVEFFIYWMHRGLHDIKPLYKLLHATHHIYNKENTLSPFAGLAFNPFDGIIQACPHVFALFVLPTHFFTHESLLFFEAIWTTNIHDCLHGNIFGIMGAGYHTIHHTTYRHNYGHYTIFMDWLLGTLRDPMSAKEQDMKTA